jgi:hypothetical protein
MRRATLVRHLANFTGDARLYRLDPPLSIDNGWDEDTKGCVAEYVVVSATHAMFSGPETYIFPADADGNVTNWGELAGSYRGGLDHEAALSGAGYEAVSA